MPRFSKPVVEDERGELIIPGAYGAAPGGFIERRSTFEWDNEDRAAPAPLIDVDELSVELSDSDEEEEQDNKEGSASESLGSSDEAPLERHSTRGSTPSIATAPTADPSTVPDEELGLPPESQSQRSVAEEATASVEEDDEPTEHAIPPQEVLDASVVPAPPPSLLSKVFKPVQKHKIIILVSLAVCFTIIMVVWIQRRGDTTQTGANAAVSQPNQDDPFAPPSNSVAYRADIGLQPIIAQVLTSNHNLQPNWNSPYWEALYWILYEDPLQLTKDDPQALQQRYLLAAFYFATSNSPTPRPTTTRYNRRVWNHCAQPTRPPRTSTNATAPRYMRCTHQQLTQERPSRLFAPVPNQWRWLSAAEECSWAGVDCNEEGRVTSIVLADYGLTGTIIDEIGALTHLERLSLPYNVYLEGTIPPVLFERVQKLELQHNSHNDTLLALDSESNSNYTDAPLEVLNLWNNELTGSLPAALNQMTNLRQVSLQENQFTGPLPTAEQWSRLELLRAQQNQFTGTLPTTLVNKPKLRILNLEQNAELKGTIPSEIGLSTKLLHLRLGHAQFTGSIPNELYQCVKLLSLDLQDNQLQGTMATQIGNLQQLKELYWQDNEFEGTLPTELGLLSALQEFHINGNDFVGEVPQEFCDLGYEDHPLAARAMVVVDCAGDEEDAMQCPQGCCSECCSKSTRECHIKPFAILGYKAP